MPHTNTLFALFTAATVVGLAGASATQAKPGQQQPIPWVAPIEGIAQCIDFDGDGICPNNPDDDNYTNEEELALGSDPNDANSTPEYGLLDEQLPNVDLCGDGVDNDLDGRIDKRDSSCRVTCRDFQAGLACSDHDKDGILHYVEVKLGSDPNAPAIPFVTSIVPCIDFDSLDCGPGDYDADGWHDDIESRLGSDPADSSSTPEYGLVDEQTGSSTCNDATDNDGDGLTDGDDDGCGVTCRNYAKARSCRDRDHDGWLSYVELRHGSDSNDPVSLPETPELPATCSDGIDNDADGLTDLADCSPCIDFDFPFCTP